MAAIQNASARIPLYRVHMPGEVQQDLGQVLFSEQLARGPSVYEFERLLQEYLNNPYVVATSNTSLSIALCLHMAGVRPWDEVIASPMACLSTNMPILNVCAVPKWCDIDPLTGNIDPMDIERKITPNTRAVIVFHWAGSPAALEEIYTVAHDHGLVVIEDAGEALGAEYRNQKIGATGGDYVVFSFYANRHITTGEGAAIAFPNKEIYEHGRRLCKYGIDPSSFRTADGEINPDSDIRTAGVDILMNNLAATIGVSQMPFLESIVRRHHACGEYFDMALKEIPGVTLLERSRHNKPVHWVYTFLADGRDMLMRKMKENGVCASKVHLRNDVYSCFGSQLAQPLAGVEMFSAKTLSIPCGWWLTQEDCECIAGLIKEGW